MTITSCPVFVHFWGECLLYKADTRHKRPKLCPCFCLLQAKHTTPLQPVLVHHMSWPHNHVSAGLTHVCLSLSYWCDHNWTQYSRGSLKSDELRGIFTTLAKAAQSVICLQHNTNIHLSVHQDPPGHFPGCCSPTLLNFSMFQSVHSSSLLMSLWMATMPSSIPIPPPKGGVIQELDDGASCLNAQLAAECQNSFSPSINSKKDFFQTASRLKFQTIDCYSLSPTVQPIFHPPCNPLIQTIPPCLDTRILHENA